MKNGENRKELEEGKEKSILKSWLVFAPLIVCLILVFLSQRFNSGEQEVNLSGESHSKTNPDEPISDQELEKLAKKNNDLVNEKKGQKRRKGNSSLARKQSSKEQAQVGKPVLVEASKSSSIKTNLPEEDLSEKASQESIGDSDQTVSLESQKLASALPTTSFGNDGASLDISGSSAAPLAGPSDLGGLQTEQVIHFDQNYSEPVEIQLGQQGSIVTENGSSVHRLSEALEGGESEASFNLERIGFEADSANLLGGSEFQIRNLASVLRNYPDYQLEIRSPVSSDRKTAQQRAEQIRGKLMSEGVESSRLTSGTSSESASDGQVSLHLSRR